MASKLDEEELQDSIKIYKIVGIVIAILFLIGIIYAVMSREKAPQPSIPEPTLMPSPQPTPVATPTPMPIVQENITAIGNITTIPEPQNISVTNETLNQTQNQTTVTNYSWDTLTINFPDTLQKIPSGLNSYHYIEILEADGTPITNEEDFIVSVIVDSGYGRKTEPIATFENKKWLIALLLANKGSYTLTLTVSCENKFSGHCLRLYTDDSVQKTATLEVV